MKNIGPVIVIGMLLLGALVVFLMIWGPMAPKPGMRQIEEQPGITGEPKGGAGMERSPRKPAAEVEAAEGRSETRGGPGATRDSSTTGDSDPARGEAPAVEPPARNFPSAADIPVGMVKSSLVGRYGDPDMVTTAVDRGRLIETYVYLRRDPNAATVVMLRGNRVIGSQTTVY